jgi:phosphoglycolate phosphatase-like HAD superfamily hydrolase
MIRNLIWDVDGTLFDTYPAIVAAFDDALRDLGAQTPPERIRELCLVSLDHCVSVLADEHDVPGQALEDAFVARYGERAVTDSPPFPGVVEVCRYVASIGGTNVIVTHRRRSSTDALLAANGMHDLFAGVITAADGHPRKPDPAMFEMALAEHALARDATMSVGDRALDVDAGRAAGVATCLFGPGRDAPAADLVVDDFRELLGHLERVNGAGPAVERVDAARGDGR